MDRWKRLISGVAVTVAALALAAPAAGAAKPEQKPAATPACAERQFSPVFASWNDQALYTLAPDGDFEARATGWTLDGAVVAAESSPFVLGALGVSALELRAGASAVSPPICVQRGFPGFRFVARSVQAARLRVEVLYASGA